MASGQRDFAVDIGFAVLIEHALRAGIQMEVDAIALYKGLSALAADQSARNMFNTLVLWEEEHLFILNYWLGVLNR